MPRRNRGRERLNSGGERKCYRISCRSPECGRVRHALPLRSSPARDEGATGAFCSCGIYRNRTPDTPAFLPKRKSDHHSANGIIPTSSSKCPADWTCGFARFRTLKCPAGISIPNFCARAGAVAARQSRGGNCEPELDRSGTACPHEPLRQFLTYPIPREERE